MKIIKSKIYRTVIIALCLVFAALSPYAAAGSGPILTAADMKSDLAYIRDVILSSHPKYADRSNRIELKKLEAELSAGLKDGIERSDFYFVANRLVSSVQDAHTSLYFTGETSFLPIAFRWTSDGIAVLKSECEVPAGSMLVALGGRSIESIFPMLREQIPAENNYWVRYRSEQLLTFGSYLARFGLISGDGSVRVDYDNGKGVESAIVPLTGNPLKTAPLPDFGWKIDKESSTGIFTLNRCNYTPEYRAAVEAFFTAVKQSGVNKVAIDVRRNGGGNSQVVDDILKYLPAVKVKTFGCDIRFSSLAMKQRRYPLWFGTIRQSFVNFFTGSPTQKCAKPSDKSLVFKGKVYVLTSWATFSSANWVGLILKDNGLAEIVGEPTGNKPSSYGDILRVELPRSKFIMSISHKRWYRPDKSAADADCLEPDHLVPTTVRSTVSGDDPQLRWVMEVSPSSSI